MLKQQRAELERAYDKIIAWFFAYPNKEFSLSDISNQLEISKSAASKITTHLKEEDFLTVDVLGKIWRIKANQDHGYFKSKKIPQNLMHILESNILKKIKEKYPNYRAIVLFGSYRKGEDLPQSDLDIAIEVLGNQKLEIETLSIVKLGYREKVNVNIHLFSRNNIDLNLFNSIANGIVLEGFLEVKP